MIPCGMLLLLPAASAAEVTTMPDRLGGALEVRYRGRIEVGSLVEGTQTIAKRKIQEHHVDVDLEFAPIAGAAVVLGLEATPSWNWSYPDARTMTLEPVGGGGSYEFGEPDPEAPVYTRKGSGLAGVWIGAAFSPFSERLFPKQRGSWRFDVGVRPGSKKSNRWTVNNGKRGASMGGNAVRLSGAFSQRSGLAEPYVRAVYQNEGKVTVALADEQGPTAPEFTVKPASSVEITGGTSILGNKDSPGTTSFDIHIGAAYRTWEDLPSGMLLPNVLASAKAVPATHSETVTGLFGMGTWLAFGKNIGMSLGAEFTYTVPNRQEHLFEVTTSPDTFGVQWHAALRGTLSRADFAKK